MKTALSPDEARAIDHLIDEEAYGYSTEQAIRNLRRLAERQDNFAAYDRIMAAVAAIEDAA